MAGVRVSFLRVRTSSKVMGDQLLSDYRTIHLSMMVTKYCFLVFCLFLCYIVVAIKCKEVVV